MSNAAKESSKKKESTFGFGKTVVSDDLDESSRMKACAKQVKEVKKDEKGNSKYHITKEALMERHPEGQIFSGKYVFQENIFRK